MESSDITLKAFLYKEHDILCYDIKILHNVLDTYV